MSLDNIIGQIEAEAQKNVDQIISAGKQKVEEIKKRAHEEAMVKKEAILTQAHQKAQEREKRLLQMAHLASRKAILAEKQKAIGSLFQAALNHIAGLNPGRYKNIIQQMLIKTVKTGKEEIILSPRDKKILDTEWLRGVNKEIGKKKGRTGELRLSQEVRDIKGGFILRDGQVEMNCSFEAILKYKRYELESEVARLLSGT